MPRFDTVNSVQELVAISSVEKDASSVEDGTLTATLGGEVNERDTSINPPSWEKIVALLKKVPCFTAPELPVPSLDALFPLTHRHFVNLPGDPPITVVSHLSHGTPESVLRCIHPMQKYTAKEMIEVVRFDPFLPKFTIFLASDTCFNVLLGSSCYPQLDAAAKLNL